MLNLVNYWSAYGGMPQYVRLSARPLICGLPGKTLCYCNIVKSSASK